MCYYLTFPGYFCPACTFIYFLNKINATTVKSLKLLKYSKELTLTLTLMFTILEYF